MSAEYETGYDRGYADALTYTTPPNDTLALFLVWLVGVLAGVLAALAFINLTDYLH